VSIVNVVMWCDGCVVVGTYIASGDVGAASLLNLITAYGSASTRNTKLPADHHTPLKLQ